MTRLLVLLLGAGLLTSQAAADRPKSPSVQGVWQAVEVTMTGPIPKTITIPEPRPNLTILTAKHYSRVQIEAEGPRPLLADVTKASADELRAAWGPFTAEAGTYGRLGMIVFRKTVCSSSTSASARSATARPRRSPPCKLSGEGGNGTRYT